MLQPKVIKVEPLPDYQLKLFYETGEIRLFDVTPYICGDWFGELLNEAYFKTVRSVPGGNGVEWINGQDVAPHELYNNSVLIA